MKIPKIWFVSDTHFDHFRIIEYCHRPYKTVEEMNEDIIQKWNSVVGNNDVVWHLGDLAFFNMNNVHNVVKILNRLNGTKNLILGNHDKHITRDYKFWLSLGFKKVCDQPYLFMDNYILSHEPLITKNGIDLTYHPKLKNIFGHVHNSNADFYAMKPEDQKHWNDEHPEFRTIPDITKHSFNVSIEVIDYKPIAFETIVEKMKNA